ncbi:Methyltransferase [Frankia sp. AgKG'84/4]
MGEPAAGAAPSPATAGAGAGPDLETTVEATDVSSLSGTGGAPGAPGESLATLLQDYRVHARAPRRVVAALTERPRTLRELVQESGLPRRSVEEILACLGADLRPAAGERQVLRAGTVDHYRAMIDYTGLRESTPIDPLAAEIRRHGALVTTLHELIAAAPRPRAEFDHVPATAATVVRRAVWLASHYDLREARLLCVGDHDLTSLAVALLAERDAGRGTAAAAGGGPSVTVVDIDEDLLEYLERSARSLGVTLRCRYADLRFGLPPSLAGSADLVFTDPPYTPAGVSLFAARGAQALADRDRGRVLVAYGYSTRTPALGAKVQRALLDQGFVFEAVWPDFHTYDGAEAVGARAAMYVCQPTPATWKRLDRPADREPVTTTIYTRGRQSEEGRAGELPVPVLEAAGRFLADAAPARPVYIGERPAVAGTHTRLATVLDRGLPPAAAGPGGRPAVVADLTDDPGPWLIRLLLAVNADRLAVIVDAGHPDLRSPGPAGALRAKWTATPEHDASPAGGSRTRLVTFAATDLADLRPGERLARWLLDRPHGRLGNIWRDGLIGFTREGSARTLTQREAMSLVRGAAGDPDLLTARLIDLPRRTLAATLAAAAATVAAATTEPAS